MSREGEMLHHWNGGLWKEWVSERVVVASLMQHAMGAGSQSEAGKMLHHSHGGLRKEWSQDAESRLQQ